MRFYGGSIWRFGMDAFCESLNELLVNAFRSVLKIEEKMLQGMSALKLSISEIHLLEVVGHDAEAGRTVSETAKKLSLTVPTVTIAVNKLEKKGLLCKTKATADGRAVILTLTESGQKVDRIHHHFHESMVKNIAEGMDESEKAALLKGMLQLNSYFNRKLAQAR